MNRIRSRRDLQTFLADFRVALAVFSAAGLDAFLAVFLVARFVMNPVFLI